MPAIKGAGEGRHNAPSRPGSGRAIACVCCSLVHINSAAPTSNGRERTHKSPTFARNRPLLVEPSVFVYICSANIYYMYVACIQNLYSNYI